MSISLLLVPILIIGAAVIVWYMLSSRARDDAAPLRARLWLKIWQWKQRRTQKR